MRLSDLNPAAIVKSIRQGIVDNLGLHEGLAVMGKFPTPDEYLSDIHHALESWPESLHKLSLPSTSVAITYDELKRIQRWSINAEAEKVQDEPRNAWRNARATLAKMTAAGRSPDDPLDSSSTGNDKPENLSILNDPLVTGVIDRVNDALKKFPYERPFFKLGTRSGKDCPFYNVDDGRVSSGEQVVLMLLTSRRLFADLVCDEVYKSRPPMDLPHVELERKMQQAAKKMKLEEFAKLIGVTDLQKADALRNSPLPEPEHHMPHLWFREYRSFPRHAEFRCFVNNGKYMGATQYHDIWTMPSRYTDENGQEMVGNKILKADPLPELVKHGWTYDGILKRYAKTFIEAATTMRSAIYDVVVDRNTEEVILLETNPANSRTFPGLKDWSRPETFNGELDWIEEPVDFTNQITLTPEHMEELKVMAAARAKYLAEHSPEIERDRGR